MPKKEKTSVHEKPETLREAMKHRRNRIVVIILLIILICALISFAKMCFDVGLFVPILMGNI